MSRLLQIYHHLPYWARVIAASSRGLYLNSLRYDRNTERLVAEALERDHWNSDQWDKWRQARLQHILHRAATKVPYYREMWARRRRRGDTASAEYLENWPILEKPELRKRPLDFVADDISKKSMHRDHTSGTTGTALEVYSTPETLKSWYALFEARCRRWYGLSRSDRWALIGGQLIVPPSRRKPPFWVWNAGMKQLYLSSYHLAPELIGSYLDAIKRSKVKYILGYPSAVYELAREALRPGRKVPHLDLVVTNAEPIYQHQRETIEEAFRCRVRETYGMAEMVAGASECDRGRLHEWPDAGVIERTDNHPGVLLMNEFVCTGLLNTEMPLIRYRVGDSGRFANERCSCGIDLPVIDKIEGRTDDLLLTSDGRRVGRLDPVFKGGLPIREAQIVQKAIDRIEVRIVPDTGCDAATYNTVADRIRDRMGEIKVTVVEVAEVPRTSRGKFRAVVCELDKERIG